MRTLSTWSTLSFALLVVALAGCPGGDDASAETGPRDGAAAGGSSGTGGSGAAGDGEFGGEPSSSSGGSGGSNGENDGGAGMSPSTGAGGTGSTPPGAAGSGGKGGGGKLPELTDNDGCVGKFQQNALWPAEGRCSARQGNAPAPGPQGFKWLKTATLTHAIAASPVIDAAGNVFVVNARGLTRFDRALDKPTELFKGAITSAPVITADDRVVALTEKGELVAAPVAGPSAKPIVYERAPGEPTTGWTSSLAVDAEGRLVFASPKGTVYIVNPVDGSTDFVSLGSGVTVNGSSIAISTQGDLAVGTNKGLFVMPRGQNTTTQIAIPSAPVSRTAVFIPKGGKSEITAIYADDLGIVHNVVVKADGKAVDTPSTGAPPLGLSPGAPAVLVGDVAQVFIGDGPLLRLLDTSDGPAVVDSQTVALAAAGPIVGAAATDSAGQIFVPSTDGSIYRLVRDQQATTEFLVADSFLTEGSLTTAPALAGNRLYFGSSDKKLYLISEAAVTGTGGAP